uniref:Uncharacterized protein n=1 Tax=Oryza brachyantha TaxID=4533 RepID=J3MSV6_ORYBR
MGHGLEKYVQRTGHKMHISFTDGKRRPLDPTQASKLASECGIHIRNHLRVATHWKMYKTNDYKKAIPAAITSIAEKFDMNANDEVARATCTNIIKDGIRQQRYRLKSKYFNNVPISEVLSKGPPPRVSPEDWAKLVEKWTDPKHKETCEKNKINREQVKFHQTTGSRSYVCAIHSMKVNNNDQEPDAIDFFKESHFSKKKGSMSDDAQEAYVQELRDQLRVEKDDNARKQHQLTEQLECQQQEITELKRKHQEEMDNLKKSQDEKMDGLRKKQDEMEAMFWFFIRQQ